MIEITRHADGITIRGHAGYAPRGQDIVCAAVTTLTYNLLASIEVLTSDTIKYTMMSGSTDIFYGNLSEAAMLLVDSFFVGMRMIADEYPENVRVILSEP